jgi:oxygen-dependent protoporphyrinogen oxidase
MRLRGGGELLLDGEFHPTPNSLARILRTDLLPATDKARFLAFMASLLLTQRGDLHVDMRWDGVTALDALAPAGRAATENVVRPTFEGPFFARLEEMSGTLVRSWLRAISTGRFFQVDGGMDSPWRRLAASLDTRLGTRVEAVETSKGAVVVVSASGTDDFDAAVIAIPAPLAARLAPSHPASEVLARIRYAPHVRLYAARRAEGGPRSGIHAFPNETVATVELSSGRHGAWGRVPDDWEWLLVCAPAATSTSMLETDEEGVKTRLWDEAARIDTRIFPLDEADIVHLIRWTHAVPVVDVGYYARLRQLVQTPPLVFCGDWLVQPCVEGAVRSGLAAAAMLG